MGTDDINPPKSGRRWTGIALILSLAVNLLVVGVVIGAMLSGGRGHRPDGGMSSYGPFTRALSDADQRAVRDAVRGRGDPGAHRRELRAGFEAFLTELRRSPYDPAAAAAALERQHQQINGQILTVREALLERLEAMTDAERAAFADRLQKAVRKRKKDGPDR